MVEIEYWICGLCITFTYKRLTCEYTVVYALSIGKTISISLNKN